MITDYWWVLAIVCLAVTLLIETSSWCLRAGSGVNNQGLYNSRVNIYLYAARFFYLIFMVLMAWAVDAGATPRDVLAIVGAALVGGLVAHLIYVFVDGAANFFDSKMLSLLIPEVRVKPNFGLRFRVHDALFGWSAFSSVFMMLGVTLPFIAAAFYPDSRMMISSLGQAVTAIGTIVTLFRVDYAMYRSMDTGSLPDLVGYFVAGRITALALLASVITIAFFLA